jgi:triosephosphate isomerase
MQKIVVANWKAALSPGKTGVWLETFKKGYRPYPSLRVVLASSFLQLPALAGELSAMEAVFLAAQDVSPFPPGKYTGAVPAAWLAGLADYVLIGHRERRKYFHETIQDAANKAREAAAAGLRPILCLDRKEAGAQVAALDDHVREKTILAYTPGEAESLETAASPDEVADAAAYLSGLSGGRPVLYGGGVNAGNAAGFMALPGVAGVMTAAGSLDPESFVKLLAGAGQAAAGSG